MLGDQPTKVKIYLGIWTAIQGCIFVGVSIVTLPMAFHVAEILYAEDFNSSEGVPSWFGVWRLTMFHPYLTESIFLGLGLLLVTVGLLCVKRSQSARRWLEWTLIVAASCIFMLSVALVPLSNMGRDWSMGTLAHDLRLTLVWNTFAAWFELAALFASIAIAKRYRT